MQYPYGLPHPNIPTPAQNEAVRDIIIQDDMIERAKIEFLIHVYPELVRRGQEAKANNLVSQFHDA